jgi:hypothetical protein
LQNINLTRYENNFVNEILNQPQKKRSVENDITFIMIIIKPTTTISHALIQRKFLKICKKWKNELQNLKKNWNGENLLRLHIL